MATPNPPTPLPTVFSATLRPTVHPGHVVPPPTVVIGPVTIALESGLELGHLILIGILGSIAFVVSIIAFVFVCKHHQKKKSEKYRSSRNEPEEDESHSVSASTKGDDETRQAETSSLHSTTTTTDIVEYGEPTDYYESTWEPSRRAQRTNLNQVVDNSFGYEIRTHQGANLHMLPPGVRAPVPSRATRDNQQIREYASRSGPLWIFRSEHSSKRRRNSRPRKGKRRVVEERREIDPIETTTSPPRRAQCSPTNKQDSQSPDSSYSKRRGSPTHQNQTSNKSTQQDTAGQPATTEDVEQNYQASLQSPSTKSLRRASTAIASPVIHNHSDEAVHAPYPVVSPCPSGPKKPHHPQIYPIISDDMASHTQSHASGARHSQYSVHQMSRAGSAPSAPAIEHMTSRTRELLHNDAKLKQNKSKLEAMRGSR